MNNPASPDKGAGAPGDLEFVTVAKVKRPRGRIGELSAVLFTDFPERFAERRRLFLLDAQGRRREMELEDHWFHKDQLVLKFKGVDSISAAETLSGCEVQIRGSERAQLDAGTFYVSDLIGCAVSDRGREIGTVIDVQFGSGEAPLLVIKGVKEYLAPFAAQYIEKIMLEQKRVEMKLPEGLLELDEPLTREEKQRQNPTD